MAIDSDTLTQLLNRLQEVHRTRGRRADDSIAHDSGLAQLRQAAVELVSAIQLACEQGYTVTVYSPGIVHAHQILSVGDLVQEVVLRYSPLVNARECPYRCILSSANRIEVVLRSTLPA